MQAIFHDETEPWNEMCSLFPVEPERQNVGFPQSLWIDGGFSSLFSDFVPSTIHPSIAIWNKKSGEGFWMGKLDSEWDKILHL